MKIRKKSKIGKKNKKAVFFSIDALIALIIILLSILVIYPILRSAHHESEIHRDVIKVFSSLKIGEVNDSYVDQLKAEGKITDFNKSVLEQIGDFYVTDKTLARNLAEAMLQYLNTSENIGIWYGNALLASKNSTSIESAKNIEAATQIIGGIKGLNETETVTGFSASAHLSSATPKKYFYFGGYIGDGNISVSVNINYTGNITGIDLETAANTNFSICINSYPCSGHFEPPASEFEPEKFDLSAYAGYFNSGNNLVKFKPTSSEENLHIAGGYMKVTYHDSGIYEPLTKYAFPGIEGLINLYDGFYVPGNLNGMEISLHYDSDYAMFLIIGNTTVFNGSGSGEVTTVLDNAYLNSQLDYDFLSKKSVPLRLGLENASYVTEEEVDVFSVVELSGSMNQNVPAAGKKVIELIKEGNEAFVVSILGDPDFRIGLVGYATDAEDTGKNHNLSQDLASLNNTIYSWTGGAGACTCCGINKAVEKFLLESDSSKLQSMVLMSDGKANTACVSGDAKQDAIDAACTAYNTYNITVNVVGFGPTTTIDEATLRAISNCGNGTYYYSNATQLAEIYQQVAQEIIEASYKEQTIETAEDISTILYPDSYIEFNYTQQEAPYGLITTLEEQFYDQYFGTFSIPSSSEIVDAVAISYSGPRWTDSVEINTNNIYNLNTYGQDYTRLGDPYVIHIPNSLIQTNNSMKITTGVSPTNSTYGSEHNKIIYTIKQNVSSFSDIVAYAKGCTWHIEFEDDSTIDVKIPESYSESENCYYNSTGQRCGERDCTDTEHPYADAVQIAVFNLLELLDFNKDGKIDVKFTEQDLQISSSEITGIPYIYSTEVQIRRWN